MKREILKNNKGVGLIEIILAMGIFALVSASMISLVLGGNVALMQGGEQTRAEGLAQEALEAVRSIREGAWNELVFSQSAIATSSGQWVFSGEGTDETIGQYNRIITFTDICRDMLHNITDCPGAYKDVHSKKLKVEVTWEVRPGVTNTVERTTYLTNWDSRDFLQTDWSAGSGQSIWTNSDQYSSDDGNIDYSTPGEIKLASLGGGGCGVKTWDFNSAGNYTYDNDIEVAGGNAQLVSNPASSWWDTNYLYRKEITITNTGTTALANFPAYLNIAKEAEMQTDFDDLRFTDGACTSVGAELDYEIEYSDTAEAHVWVRLPSLSLSSDTICMYYGNTLAITGENASGVWDSSFVAVYHMNESGTTRADSTVNGNDGVATNVVLGNAGIVGGATEFNGSDGDVDVPSSTSFNALDNLTAEAWVNTNNGAQANQVIVSFYNNIDDRTYIWLDDNTNGIRAWNSINAQNSFEATTSFIPTNNTWNHVAWRIDGSTWKLFINGVETGSTAETLTMADLNDGFVATIGERSVQDDRTWNGLIDEVRISGVARSADWIDQSYELVANQGINVNFAGVESSASYPTSRPTIRPAVTHSVSGIGNWTSFSESAIKNGTSEIYYQISDDSGSTWYYWDGFTWAVAGSLDYNIAEDINSNINTFATTTAQIMFKAFLESDGDSQVQLDSVSISCEQNYDWPFSDENNYTFDNSKIEVSGGVAQLTSSSGSGATIDSEFSYGTVTNTNWPFDTPLNYVYDNSKIEVTGGLASLIGTSNDTFRIKEYYLADGDFSGKNYSLTLDQDLESNYFVIIQGSDGDGSKNNTTNGDDNSVSLVSDPFGTGDLGVSGGSDVIDLFRNGAVNSWVGVITVVECLNDCDASGFKLLGVERVNHTGGNEIGTDTATVNWTDIDQIMLMGGFNGSGCDTIGTGSSHIKSCQARIWPSGLNIINWQRDVTGGAITTAVSTVMLVEWGNEWEVQRVTVSGNNGGNGVNATREYDTATINSVARDNTWVWGTGWTNDGGIGDAAEGTLITLGDGVNQNTNETTVAVGQEYSDTRAFEVYALTHSDLQVDYRFKTDGSSTSITYDQTTDTVSDSSARMALVTNGCNGTGQAYPRPIFSARYLDDSTIRLERRRSGQSFPAWVQGIDFSAIATPLTYPSDSPDIYPTSSYSLIGMQSWDSFTETANKNGGDIQYQLSDDDGITWQYWNGTSWAIANDSSSSNIASVIDANISSFSTTNNQIKFRAFILSDSTELVQLDNIDIDFTPLSSPWSFSTWDVGGGEVTPSGLLQTSGGNPNGYVDVYVPLSKNDEIGGYWEQAFTVTANNPTATIDFDYSVLDYNSVPNLAEIRVYVDSISGNPVNQVGSSISLTGTTAWLSASTIIDSLVITTPGTYYLKIALWVESGKNDGPYEVGFDNVSLDWDASGYSSDSPTIQPVSAYSVVNLDRYNGFAETATKAGTSEIYYQLSSDAGTTWEYWNGVSWAVAGAKDYNIATDIDTNISSFATTSASIIFKAFLMSDGTDQIKLNSVRIGWGESGSGSSGYATMGSLVSSAFNMGDASPVQVLEWDETMVTGGEIGVQIRTAPDNSGSPGTWTAWQGAGGAGTYFTDPLPILLSTDLNGNQWVQYQIKLTGDGSDTPVLNKIIINYK